MKDLALDDIVFWILAVASISGALGVVVLRDIFRAALMLITVFLALAGFFVLLNAEFLAVVQVLIYAGAISILIIFAIMLTRDVHRGNLPTMHRWPALVLSSLVLAGLVFVMVKTHWRLWETLPVAREAVEQVYTSTPSILGSLLLQEFVLPFEAASVLLLAALLGALALVREAD